MERLLKRLKLVKTTICQNVDKIRALAKAYIIGESGPLQPLHWVIIKNPLKGL